MANKKISELAAAGALTGAELVEAVQGGVNVQTTTQNIANLAPATPGAEAFLDLTDVPGSYSGEANKVVSVKADESGLEFTTSSASLTGGSGITVSSGAIKLGKSSPGGIVSNTETYIDPVTPETSYIYFGESQHYKGIRLIGSQISIGQNNFTDGVSVDISGFGGDSTRSTTIGVYNNDNGLNGAAINVRDSSAINNVVEVIRFRREVGTGVTNSANGVGEKINFTLKNSVSNDYSPPAGISYILTDVTDGSEDSKYVFSVLVNGVETTSFEITGDGIVMGGKKITGLGAATANGDAVRYEQVFQDFSTLVDGSSVTWNTDNKQNPLAKLTSTQSFTIDMTNVKSGASGILKLIKNTASDLVLTFDTSFTNKQLNTTLTNYTFTGASGSEYFLSFIAEGTNIEWVIGDFNDATTAPPVCRVRRTASQSTLHNTLTPISFDTEDDDTGAIWALSPNPTRLVVPGSGSKAVTISVFVAFASNSTGIRRIYIYKNGSALSGSLADQAPSSGIETYMQRTFQTVCSGGDYFEVNVLQTSTGSLNVTLAAVMVKVDDL